jgi:alkylation response protein AidB-like acyl-CoA dehydrogenase
MGGAEADPVTEMLVLEALAYDDLTSGWCTMVGATAIASLGTFLPPSGLQKVFKNGHIPTAAISFFPAGRAVRDGKGYRVNGRWRFNSGIRHAEWVLGGTVVEGSEAENGGRPIVMFSAFPIKDVTIHDNWGGVVGLRGTGSCDFSVENYHLPEDLTFVWDLLKPKPRRGGPSYLFPPFSYVAKEHGSVAIGAARRALDELIGLATTTRGTFRSSRLDERQVVHRFIAEADLKLRAARALMHERYDQLYDSVSNGSLPDGAAIADVRAICVHATDVAIETATMCYHFAGNTGLHHPHVMGRLLRDLNTAGLHQVMSDTAYENHGKFRLGLPADPLA